MKGKVSWEEILDSSQREGDEGWTRLITEPDLEVEAKVRELEQNPPTGGAHVMVVRGEQCRDSEGLFREFDREWESFWGTPDYSERNWDDFDESVEELVDQEREDEDPFWYRERPDTVLVLVLHSLELLRDEPKDLRELIGTLRSAAFGILWDEKDKPRRAKLRVLFQCEPAEAEALKERLVGAGLVSQEEYRKRRRMYGLSWQKLLYDEGRRRDSRWARLISGPEARLEERVRELAEQPPSGGAYVVVVRGEQCRDSERLFREWESFWGTPDHSGHNWDAFGENLQELVAREREDTDPIWWRSEEENPNAALVLILRSPELLQDEPESLQTLVEVMRTAAFGLAWEDKDRLRIAKLNIVFQCEPEEVESLREHLTRAGLDL